MNLQDAFEESPEIEAIVPRGNASFGLLKGKYGFHDPYFMTSRCTVYCRLVLMEPASFIDDFFGQEDLEYVVSDFMVGQEVQNVLEMGRLGWFF